MLRYLSLVLLVPVAVMSASPASAAAAAQTADVETTQVSIRGVDLDDAAQAEAFYGRLEDAAHKVCDAAPGNDITVRAENADCLDAALNRVIKALDRPLLLAVHRDAVRNDASGPRR